jgi:adhesin transport system outer membrane protein
VERADLLAVQNHPGLAMNLTTVRNRRARFSGALLIGSALILLAGATNSVAQVSLQTAIQRAAQVDPNITALRQQITSREIGIQEARDAYYPSLSIGADTNTTDANGPGLTVTISQVIYDWGLTRSNIATASQSRVQAVSDLKIALEGLTLRVAEAFLDVEIAEMKLRLTEDYMDYAGRIARQAEDRARAGLSDRGEVARAQLEIARARDQVMRLRADHMLSLAQIEFLIDSSVNSVTRPPEIGFQSTFANQDKITSSVRMSPEYISARSRVDEATAGVERAKASRLPTIRLQAQGRKDLNGGRTRTSLGVSAGTDLNAGTLSGRAVQIASQDLGAAQSSLVAIERMKVNDAVTSLKRLQSLRANESSRRDQLTQAVLVLENYEVQFIGGLRELIDVLTTGRDLYDARIDQVDTYDERKRTEYRAARDIGMLGTLIAATAPGQ